MNPVDKGIYEALSADAALVATLGGTAIYQWLAPEGSRPPYVVFNQQSGVPAHTFGGVAYEDQLYTVKGVTAGPSAALAGTIAQQIDAALSDQPISVTGYGLMYLRRSSDLDLSEIEDGQRYHHRGGVYRILTAPN